jgi:hypothetical protein
MSLAARIRSVLGTELLAKLPVSLWAIPAIAIVLMWPALLNGYPFLFADTDPYIRQGQQIFPAIRQVLAGEPAGIDYMQSRSVFLGAYLYQTYRVADFWGVAVIQALTMAWLIWTVAKAFGAEGKTIAAVVAVLALTTAPFEAVFMMPDAWTGTGLLAGLLLMFAPDRLNLVTKVLIGAIFLFSLLVHQTHLMLAIVLILAGIGLLLFLGRTLKNAVIAAAPLAALALGSVAINASINTILGTDLSTFPFVTARVLEDGPGRKHLDAACATDPDAYELCRFRNNPLDNGLDVLFSNDPGAGAFALSDREGQIRLNGEQSRFVVQSVLGDPLGTIGAAVANGTQQLGRFALPLDFNAPTGWTATEAPEWGGNAQAQIIQSATYEGAFPLVPISAVIYVVVIASAAFLIWRLTRSDILQIIHTRTDKEANLLIGVAALITLLIVVNAFLCAVFSGVYDRFQIRIIWLLPFVATLVAVRFGFSDRPLLAAGNAQRSRAFGD